MYYTGFSWWMAVSGSFQMLREEISQKDIGVCPLTRLEVLLLGIKPREVGSNFALALLVHQRNFMQQYC